MTRPQPTAFERELERRLPSAETIALAAITFGSFALILMAQAF